MVRWWLGISVLLSMVVVLSAPRAIAQDETDCMDDPLGSAQDFEITAFGDLDLMNTDTEGPMAVGGNATLQNYTVNALRANQGYTGLALSVGKNLVFTNGSIWGAATVGGRATLTGVGGVTSLTQGTPPPVPDFAALLQGLATRSEQWADIEPAGTAEPYPNGILLKGTDPIRNVFKVSAQTLAGAGEININVPVGSTTLINVTGTAYSLGSTSTIRYYDTGTGTYRDWGRDAPTADLARLRDGTLWNFPDATKLDFLKGLSWQGSILAPKAVMDVTYLQINGNVIVGALYGTGETHFFPPNLCLPDPTPCPPQPPLPTPTPTATVSPTPQPTVSPTPTPTVAPIVSPTPTPTAEGGTEGVSTDVQICKKVMTPNGRALERIRVHAGDTVRFRIRITNLGTETARNAVVCDLLPREMTLVKAPARPFYRNGRPCLRIPRLRGQLQGYITVRVARTARGLVTNVAAVSSSNSGRHVNPASVRVLAPRPAPRVTG